jgi:hypothetical protein
MSIDLQEGLPGEGMKLPPLPPAKVAQRLEPHYAVQSKIGARWVTVELFGSRAAAFEWLKPVIARCGNSDGLRVRPVRP